MDRCEALLNSVCGMQLAKPNFPSFHLTGLSRGYEPGLRELLSMPQGGFSVIIDCLCSGIRRVAIKTLFMISSFYTSETSLEVQGIVML